MTRTFFMKIITVIISIATLFSVSVLVLLPRVLNLDNYKTYILNTLETSLKRPVTYDSAAISWQFYPAVVFKGLKIKESAGDTKLLTVDRLTFRVALLPLLHKEVRIHGVVLERPELMLVRNQDGTFSVNDLFTDTSSTFEPHIQNIKITDGTLRFTDHLREKEVLVTTLEQLNMQIDGLTRGKSSEFTLAAVIDEQRGREELSLWGEAGIPLQGEAVSAIKLNAALTVKNINLARYWPYYGRFLPFEKIQGQLDVVATLKGTMSDFSTEGDLTLKKLHLEYPEVFHVTIMPEEITLRYSAKLDSKNVLVKSFDLNIDGLQLKGSGALLDRHDKDPHLKATVSSSPLHIEELKHYIPYGVIPNATADFLEKYIKGGVLTVEKGTLDGTVSQIRNMGVGTNYNIVSVRASINNGQLRFGPQVPMISQIKTDLEFHGKDFSLRNATGIFGQSPFTLEGTIAGYPLDTPASYPFSMRMSPAQSEIDWLLRQNKEPKLIVSGPSSLLLSGVGLVSDYRLSGAWDLSGAVYQYSSVITKPAGMSNRVTFGAVFAATQAQISELHYELPSLDVNVNATYRYNDKVPLSAAVTTNLFDVAALLPVIHGFDKYHLSGMAKAAFNASGHPSEPQNIRWQGAVTLAEFSLRPFEQIAPLSGINSTITISESGLETKQLTGHLGKSDVTVSGSVKNFRDPVSEIHFSSPLLHLSDLGLISPGEDRAVKNVSSHVFMKNNRVDVQKARLDVFGGTVSGKGTADLSSQDGPLYQAHYLVERVDVRQLLMLAGKEHVVTGLLTSEGDFTATGNNSAELKKTFRGTAKLGISEGGFKISKDTGSNVPVSALNATLAYKNGSMIIHDFNARVCDGTVSGSGTADFSTQDGPLYQAHYRVENVDVTQLLTFAGKEHVITGLLTSEGDLTAEGNNGEELLKSVRGSNKFQMGKGVIYKSNVLLKVFSVFNVTRILKFRLPRIAQEGTLYDSIQGSFNMSDGCAETTDMTLQSPSVTVKAVGKTDFIKKELDMVLAAQPLQTISYVVSHIPVLGWLLTGGDQSFLVSFFDVKGNWNDPVVSTRPVENLSTGVYNIFKRTFMLPETLVTDTNKVIFD